MAGLGGDMPGMAVIQCARVETRQRQHGRCRDKPVEQHRYAVPPRRQHGAGDRSQFAAAERRRHGKGIPENVAVKMQAGLDRRALARKAAIIDAGAAAGPASRAAAEQCGAQHRRRRGIGDAHLADRQQVAILRHRAVADIDRVQEFIGIHRGRHR